MADLTDFVAALKGHVNAGAVSALIGERFTPVPIPEGTDKPRAAYTIVQTLPQTTLDGDDDGLLEVTVDIFACGNSFDEALLLAETIRARMVSSSFKATPTQSDGNGAHDYEPVTRSHLFVWRYICWFST